MDCPKCGHAMDRQHFGASFRLQRCTHCMGIWCNAAQIGELGEVPMIDVLDTGAAAVGEAYDKIRDIECPECGKPMSRETIPHQPHIAVEVCAECPGIFLDAGELRDAKHYTVGDWVKALKIKFARD